MNPLIRVSLLQRVSMDQLLAAATFSARKHSTQRRKNIDQSPYINHPLDVANRLSASTSSLTSESPFYLEILQAALLHDTIEDTQTSPEEIEAKFGRKVREIVMECTDDGNLLKEKRKQLQIDTAPHKSIEAKHVKLADKLSNLSDLAGPRGVPVGWTAIRVQEYFVWGKQVTDGCKEVNPGLAQQLDTLYRTAKFEHQGKIYQAHPSYK